ncbi:hypothetical protein FHR96_004365 [Halomonas organivorans]|uniref:Uncharacterized protein n=1 Tax=Halomonas organivorans TaxID=257772 RepID=A0A7W5C477_9GAMM|nr:hypothetical protein [Halomonas organivorans]
MEKPLQISRTSAFFRKAQEFSHSLGQKQTLSQSRYNTRVTGDNEAKPIVVKCA